MKRNILIILILTVLGLLLGYLLFGKIAGEYLSISTIFSNSGGSLGDFGRNITGISKIRNNILITGGAGFVLGIVLLFVKKK
ncbi:hypothetical protein [Carboxylicivirga caseinilyticus]|uniref:hypothetical protein n=1 Tax=Carboxylicivirga caseinilyticus TaxID=3417572 RepID=UPI002AA6CB22|nr:hypothetical protein [uncultured Carboxylicivirga sp.]MCU4165194.1 hypothetical protein [Marinilabiliaceae bacterium A049]